jgi:HSP20 family protein
MVPHPARLPRANGPLKALCYDRAVAFARWDPIRDLLAIQQRLDRFAPTPGGWAPSVDVHETDDRYVVTAEVPGLNREDIQIHVQDGQLTLSGTRRDRGAPCEQYHRIERGHGAFSRTFHLPLALAEDQITADLKDGVLIVVVPKTSDPTPRRIRVS